MKKKGSALFHLGVDFADGMNQRKLTVFATSGCYYLFMSLVPIVMIICCILPYTPYNLATILKYIDHYFTKSLADIMRNIAGAIYSSNSATLTVSIVLTLYSASASMKALMKGMDSAYDCKPSYNIITFTLKALFYMVLLLATLLLSLVIMVYGGKILDLLQEQFHYFGILDSLLSKSRYFMVMLVLTVLFTLLYRVMPSCKVKLLNQIPGAVFSAITWVIFSSVFTIYIGISNRFGAYGFIGTIMVAMLWMHYCFFFLLIGGYMNSFLSTRRSVQRNIAFIPEEELASPALSAYVSDSTASEDSGEAEVKKGLLPLLIGTVICAFAAFATVFLLRFQKKKNEKDKASAPKRILTRFSVRKKALPNHKKS